MSRRITRRCWMFSALLFLCATGGAAQTNSAVNMSGRWVALDGMPGGPYIFDLTVTGNTVTGRVAQHGGEPGPAVIYDGRIAGNTITFKCKTPGAEAKTITFTGELAGDQLTFARSVEVAIDGPVDNSAYGRYADTGVFGATGPRLVQATRTGPVPVPAVPMRAAAATPVDPTGKWDSLRWNLDVWSFEFKVTGGQLTGAVIAAAGPGRQASTYNRPVPIYDGKIDRNTIFFKIKSPDNIRSIVFTGKMQDDEIVFTRSHEIPRVAAFGVDAIYGVYATQSFLAKRVNAGSTDELRKILEARLKWATRKFSQYEFTSVWRCFTCRQPYQSVTYRVSGEVGKAQDEPIPGFEVMKTEFEQLGSMDRLFDLLTAAALRRPYQMKVDYDPALGFPRSIEIHPGGISADDDLTIRITNFRAIE